MQHIVLGRALDPDLRASLFLKLVEELPPDLRPVLVVQSFIVDDNVNAGDNGVVELSDPVACEEKNALVVLDLSKKDCPKGKTKPEWDLNHPLT